MSRLIKNEFKKLFSKKLMYILFLIAIGFIIINNVLSSLDFNAMFNDDEFEKMEIQYYETELEELDYKKVEDNTIYIDMKTSLDLMKLEQEFERNSWQRIYIDSVNSGIYDTLWSINQNTYGFDKNNEMLKEATKKYDEIKTRLHSGNWRAFLEDRIKSINEELDYYKELRSDMKDKKELEQLDYAVEEAKIEKQCLEWRLEKDVSYSNGFLSNAIEVYQEASTQLISFEKNENRSQDEENSYRDCLRTVKINLYYIENNINEENNFIMSGFTSNYGAFITIFSIIVAGTIVSGEFQKGTIKLLLTRPYSRTKILFAKYIVSLLTIIIFIALFILAQYIAGGIAFGFDNYKIPVVEYDFTKGEVVTMSVVSYALLTTLAIMPMYILLVTFAFCLGTLFMNSAIGIAIPILGNMVSELFTLFAEKIKILKYFVTVNWDLSVYLFGGNGVVKDLTFTKSLIICIVYLLIMVVCFTVVFKRRDIKNV